MIGSLCGLHALPSSRKQANNMNHDQTAPKGIIWSWPILFAQEASRLIFIMVANNVNIDQILLMGRLVLANIVCNFGNNGKSEKTTITEDSS